VFFIIRTYKVPVKNHQLKKTGDQFQVIREK